MNEARAGEINPDSVIRNFRITAANGRTVKDSLTVRGEGSRGVHRVATIGAKYAGELYPCSVIKKYLITAANRKFCYPKRYNLQANIGGYDRFLALGGTEK